MGSKQAIRTEVRRRLKDITKDSIRDQSQDVTKQILGHRRYAEANAVGVYVSLEDEIQTKCIIADIYAKSKYCFVPRFDAKTHFMTMVRIPTLDDLYNLPRDNPYHILQPDPDTIFEDVFASKVPLDLILVPGLAFSTDGKRVGRGKGFYDRFLASYTKLKSEPYTIGLTFKESIFDSVPTTETDFVLDEVVYPGKGDSF
ncbi:5-formyltetrahydrofolate cyclo-ligase-like [Artemia franciscana]|uniref:5-formyltetrahydrofolate cyclo-ligase n=1 Tax=Artemia franciscana TaxID=6661 RepID=A0AA88H9I4_ARTSF|nr:hypothetical protein QYM36_016255 [Artemia franciscana]